MIYSYFLEFTDQATPEVEAKNVKMHGSICIEVDLGFADGVRYPEWPR